MEMMYNQIKSSVDTIISPLAGYGGWYLKGHKTISSFTNLLSVQSIIGIRSHKNKIFVDSGIAFNLFAYCFGKNHYSYSFARPSYAPFIYEEYSNQNDFKQILFTPSLWNNKLIVSNIYFNVGYTF